MNVMSPRLPGGTDPAARWFPWAVVLVGFAVLYAPVYWNVAFGENALWQSDENGHGPIILLVALWLFWSKRHAFLVEGKPAFVAGGVLFALGLLMYLFGRLFQVSSAEFASQVLIVTSAVLLLVGYPALRLLWFPVFYLLFMIPLPGTLVDALTGNLKQWISAIVEHLFYAAGYPIARSGVSITIGPYELLVADACSGLNSMFSLSALGTLYMYVMNRRSRLHNVLMLLSILPIAFAANVVRVVILVLITYHLGDEAGQGFMHGLAGFVLMGVALAIFFAFDRLLAAVIGKKNRSAAAAG